MMDKAANGYTILVVDDDSGLTELMQKHLQREGFMTAVSDNGTQAISWLGEYEADLMLLDYKLPDMTGQELIQRLVERQKTVPFILVTGQGDEQLAVEMMKGGARDYLVKDGAFLELLPSVVGQVIRQLNQEKRLEEARRARHESEARYRAMFNSALDAVLVTGMDGRIIEANPHALSMFGYSSEEFMDLSVWELLHAKQQHIYDEFLREMRRADKYTAESVAVQKDGTTLYVEIRSSVLEFKGKRHMLVIMRDISERKWAVEELKQTNQQLRLSEQVLREREARLGAIFHGAAIGLCLVDLGGRILESNQAFQEMLGYSRSELGQLIFTEHIHPEDRETNQRIFADLAGGKCDHYQLETRYVHKDSLVIWVQVMASLIRGVGGEPNYIISIVDDISERKEAEQALRESEDRFRLFSEAAFEGIIIHEKGVILDANSAYGRMFGWELSEIAGHECLEFVAPQSRELVAEKIKGESITPYEAVGLRKDGTTFFVEICSRDVNYQGHEARIVAVRDISEQKRAKEALRQSEQKYRSLFENMLNGFAYYRVADEGGQPRDYIFMEVNDAFSQMVGAKREEIIGKKLTDIIPEIKNSDFDGLGICDKVAVSEETRLERYFESWGRWVSVSAFRPQPGHLAAIFADITERRLMEEELRIFTAQVEQNNRDLEQWSKLVCGEMQKPIRKILENIRKLEKKYEEYADAPEQQAVRRLYKHALRLQSMMDGLLAYAQAGGQVRPSETVDLNRLVEQIVGSLEDMIQKKGVKLEISPLPIVLGDQSQLERIFEILVKKGIEQGDPVEPLVQISAQRMREKWEISVWDNGETLSVEDRENEFSQLGDLNNSPMQSGPYGEAAICKKIVERHGGYFRIESAPGGGRIFKFTLPEKKTEEGLEYKSDYVEENI